MSVKKSLKIPKG